MNIDWKRKLSSRKLWVSAAGLVSGLMVYSGAPPESAESAGSLVMMAASVLGYLVAEGLVDCARTTDEDGE